MKDLGRGDRSGCPTLTVGNEKIAAANAPTRVFGGPVKQAELCDRVAAILAKEVALVAGATTSWIITMNIGRVVVAAQHAVYEP